MIIVVLDLGTSPGCCQVLCDDYPYDLAAVVLFR
jgi:hypothetical protein